MELAGDASVDLHLHRYHGHVPRVASLLPRRVHHACGNYCYYLD